MSGKIVKKRNFSFFFSRFVLLLILLRFLCVLHMPPPLSPHTTRRRMGGGGGRQLIGCGGLGVIKNTVEMKNLLIIWIRAAYVCSLPSCSQGHSIFWNEEDEKLTVKVVWICWAQWEKEIKYQNEKSEIKQVIKSL